MATRDDWEKPRARGQHFSADERKYIWAAFNDGKSVIEVAKKLHCASRTITTRFAAFRAEGSARVEIKGHVAVVEPGETVKPISRADYTARLYKPNFDI